MKAATTIAKQLNRLIPISIHAAREGGDASRVSLSILSDISIHAAREGGDKSVPEHIRDAVFQSTPPVKAATCPPDKAAQLRAISIHAAREGGDDSRSKVQDVICDFNPRRP